MGRREDDTPTGGPERVVPMAESTATRLLETLVEMGGGFEQLLRELLISHGKRLDSHSERTRALEDFRLTAEATRKHEEAEMKGTLRRIEEHLEAQDLKIDGIGRQVARWGGAIAALGAASALAIAIFEAWKK